MSDKKQHAGFDLNLALMEDEALIVLAKECAYEPARDELIVRYRTQTDRLISYLAYRYHLSNADGEDAGQNAVFWIIEAINKYDTNQIGKVRGCSFRSFLHRVSIARFKDFAKHLRRLEGHYDRSRRQLGEEAAEADIDRKLDDPAELAEAHESFHRFHQVITGLDGQSVRLWRLLADGNSLRKVAAELGISYDSVKRRRRKLLAQLKIQLNPSTEAADPDPQA